MSDPFDDSDLPDSSDDGANEDVGLLTDPNESDQDTQNQGPGSNSALLTGDELAARPDIAALPGIAQARHNLDWASTFSSTPPTEVLRAQRNLTDMVASAIDRKQQIMAQTDANAQKIYFNQKKFEEWQRQAPLRDQLLQGRVQHENAMTDMYGAATKYHQQKDTDTAKDVARFYDGLSNLSSQIGTPEHANDVIQLAAQHPLAAMTAGVRNDIEKLGTAHDAAAGLYQTADALKAAHPGATYRQDVKSGEYYVFEGGKPGAGTTPSAYAMRDLATMNADLASKSTYLAAETNGAKKQRLQKDIDATKSKIQAWHDTYQPRAANSSRDQAALDWANANKNDPRSAKILALHGQ